MASKRLLLEVASYSACIAASFDRDAFSCATSSFNLDESVSICSWVESSVPQPDRKQANSKHAIAKHPRGGRRRVIVTVNVPDIYDQINFAQRSKNRTRQETPV